MSKSEFMSFAKAISGDNLRDSEMTEFMVYYAKQRASNIAKRIRGDTQTSQDYIDTEDPVIADPRVDINVLDSIFDKWYKDQEAVSGVLNIKVTRVKNIEFRKTLEAWKKRAKERVR